jgi:tRNA (guanine6-N2)-methyltransferase
LPRFLISPFNKEERGTLVRYFVRVTLGLEALAWQEIERLGATLLDYGHRRVDFTYDGPPAPLLALKSVDDIYIFIAELYGVDRTRASLRVFRQLKNTNFNPALEVVAATRDIPDTPTYTVTASHLGKRNYSRYEVEDAIQIALSEKLPWEFVPTVMAAETPHDIGLRVLIEEDWALVGLRLTPTPLHRRPYKTSSTPGSLKAPVAYALCLLAELQPADNLFDPACGAGTVLIEARTFIHEGILTGIDILPDAITAASQNSTAAGLPTEAIMQPAPPAEPEVLQIAERVNQQEAGTLLFFEGDSRTAVLPTGKFQKVITNLPWGKQVERNGELDRIYADILKVIENALDDTGRAIILTDQIELMEEGLAECPTLTVDSTFQISLFGSHPTVHILHKNTETTALDE